MAGRITPKESIFIGEVPDIEIRDGLVYVTSYGRTYVMLPSIARAWNEALRRHLDGFDREQREPVPIK